LQSVKFSITLSHHKALEAMLKSASLALSAAIAFQPGDAFVVPGNSLSLRGAQPTGATSVAVTETESTSNLGVRAAAAAGVTACAALVTSSSKRTQRKAATLAGAKAQPVKVTATANQHKSRSLHDARIIVCAGAHLPEGRKLRVAVVGGGPGGASAADVLAKAGIETYLIERKLDNCKPCGGAIPLCMIDEFQLPRNIVDREVRKMTMISPTNKEVQIGQTLKDNEFIGMVRREVLDDFLRQRAKTNGAHLINGLFTGMTMPTKKDEPYVLTYNDYGEQEGKAREGVKTTLEVDVVIGADGANSRVAKEIEAGDYEYAIAFQERMRIPDEKMEYYKDRAEMYVGEDVSPDFYAWVFPKCDHVAVGTGTVIDKKGIMKYQQGIRDRAAVRIQGGEIIRVEAHPIPEHPRPWRVKDRAALIGDAAGYVTKCSGEGIYFAAKSGRMCAERIVTNSEGGTRMIDQADLMEYIREWDGKYGPTYLVLDLLQKVFYTTDADRESFVELCEDEYVQQVTFDSYLYKTVQGNNPLGDLKLGARTLSSLWKHNNKKPDPMRTLA
jgi:geranylgeranyl diphosphate/geranylgeranyl-bacteriochlorophyllide a reductase